MGSRKLVQKLPHWTFIRCIASSANCRSDAPIQKPFYVTSPIFYVNAAPHIGHLYSTVVADIFARWERFRNPRRPVRYTTGTDEHGLKIQQAASSKALQVLELCDSTSDRFRDLAEASGISSTKFIRTTEPQHYTAVEHVWRSLERRGHIYQGTHEGWYSVSDEAFYTPVQIETVTDPKTGQEVTRAKQSKSAVQRIEEKNYKFKIGSFREDLIRWIKNTSPIRPFQRQDEVLAFLSDPSTLPDLSVSRPANRVQWGIPVPDDPSQTIYVWLDALTSYLTAIGFPWSSIADMTSRGWPADIHVVGKDILWFHAVYFPSFLMALDLPLPRNILAHAHWTKCRQKMSKSTGNVVDPFTALEIYGTDSVRWYLARIGGNFVDDVDWSAEQVTKHHNRELRGLGNLHARIYTEDMCNARVHVPPSVSSQDPLERQLAESLLGAAGEVNQHMQSLELSKALDRIVQCLDLSNEYFSQQQIWKQENEHLKGPTLALTREALRIVATLLQPFLPERAPMLLDWIGVPKDQRSLMWATFGAVQGIQPRRRQADKQLFEAIKKPT